MKKSLMVLAAAALLAWAPVEGQAQVSFGAQAALFDLEELAVGGRVNFGLANSFGIEDGFFQGLEGSVNANYLFLDGADSAFLINANGLVPLSVESSLSPYVGAGINHYRYSWDNPFGDLIGFDGTYSASGLNILAGLNLSLGALPAFAELQYSTTGAGFLTLSGGVMFGR
jgi:opacity protein-like surface antigen